MGKKLSGAAGIVILAILMIWYGRLVQSGQSGVVAVKGAEEVEIGLSKPNNQLEERDYTWRQVFRRDTIEPIYEPTFLPADQANYDDSELVIGVEINGQAKAYAIGPLNGREMVNDTLSGVPILVTW